MNRNEKTALIRENVPPLLYWYRANARVLPWRSDPTPYHVWISEIMLQQTRVEAVKPYYLAFIEELPDIPSLAAAPDERLMKKWEGLGYYSRARNLKKAAAAVTETMGGSLPADYDKLLSLPGIGDYTAGAISSIAFGLPKPAVDGNVLRVLTRLLADEREVTDPTVKKDLTAILEEVYLAFPGDASALTQSLMELGATVCLPNGIPKCEECPWVDACEAKKAGRTEEFPCKAPKKPRRIEERTVLLLCHEGKYAVRKRPDRGLLAGLYEFPSLDGHLNGEEVKAAGSAFGTVSSVTPLPDAIHIFTHIEWRMRGYLISCETASPDLVWASPEEIRSEYAVASAFRTYKNIVLQGE